MGDERRYESIDQDRWLHWLEHRDTDRFDRLAFAIRVLGVLDPPGLTVAVYRRELDLRVESGRDLAGGPDASWAMVAAFNEDFTANASFPQSCIADSTACSNVETGLKQQSGITSASCTFASNCGCDYSGSTSNNSTGTYQINGTTVTLTTDGSSSPPETDGYCVSGNTLTLTSTASGASSSLVFSH